MGGSLSISLRSKMVHLKWILCFMSLLSSVSFLSLLHFPLSLRFHQFLGLLSHTRNQRSIAPTICWLKRFLLAIWESDCASERFWAFKRHLNCWYDLNSILVSLFCAKLPLLIGSLCFWWRKYDRSLIWI